MQTIQKYSQDFSSGGASNCRGSNPSKAVGQSITYLRCCPMPNMKIYNDPLGRDCGIMRNGKRSESPQQCCCQGEKACSNAECDARGVERHFIGDEFLRYTCSLAVTRWQSEVEHAEIEQALGKLSSRDMHIGDLKASMKDLHMRSNFRDASSRLVRNKACIDLCLLARE
mmetsp:Transcript_45044/g.141813  ORF Transcript_45044/g.141813 Transcript_45044/m.141813 type:complete len:170 (-) Transcript_45044:84-593(-)